MIIVWLPSTGKFPTLRLTELTVLSDCAWAAAASAGDSEPGSGSLAA